MAPRVHHQIARRYYERLVTADDHEVWLICWDVGQMTLLHDHGSSAGAYHGRRGLVARGPRPSRIGPAPPAPHPAGRARSFGPGYVHNLANAGPGLATSIHAYTPRLTTMTYYAVLPGGAVPIRSLPVECPSRRVQL